MNDFLLGITEAAGAIYKKRAAATLVAFVGGGFFCVLVFVVGFLIGWRAYG